MSFQNIVISCLLAFATGACAKPSSSTQTDPVLHGKRAYMQSGHQIPQTLPGEAATNQAESMIATDPEIARPVTIAAVRTIGDILFTAKRTGQGLYALSGAKLVHDVVLTEKSAGQSMRESGAAVKAGVHAIANSYKIPNHAQTAIVDTTGIIFGKTTGRHVGMLFLPEQILRSVPGAIADAVLYPTDKNNRARTLAGIPIASALLQAKQYYRDKARPLPAHIKAQLSWTFPAEHLENIRYVVDDTNGSIAGTINHLNMKFGDTDQHPIPVIAYQQAGSGGSTPATSPKIRKNHAVVIDQIIVFAREPEGASGLWFWSHEIQHTMQYRTYGIDGFAARYMTGHDALELEADQVANATIKQINHMAVVTK